MTNRTMLKFGYPESLIADYQHWRVLLRPQQVTFGALVLICKGEARALPGIPRDAFTELAEVTADIETTLSALCPYDKINYLMLMMVDCDVHFHVLPRYARAREFDGVTYRDRGWPGPPELGEAITLAPLKRDRLLAALAALWPGGKALTG
ncbi:MAG: HIT family protein [Hyphomicrobiales bacterium]